MLNEIKPRLEVNERHELIQALEGKLKIITDSEIELRNEISAIEIKISEIFQKANEEAQEYQNETDNVRAQIASLEQAAEGVRSAIANLRDIDGYGITEGAGV